MIDYSDVVTPDQVEQIREHLEMTIPDLDDWEIVAGPAWELG